jgi:Arc/MetJ family transcription regulator
MCTNIVIDDLLTAAALEARPNTSKRVVVEEGLKLVALVRKKSYKRISKVAAKDAAETITVGEVRETPLISLIS